MLVGRLDTWQVPGLMMLSCCFVKIMLTVNVLAEKAVCYTCHTGGCRTRGPQGPGLSTVYD